MDDNRTKKTAITEKLKTMAHDKRVVAVTLLAVIIATYIITCVTFVLEDRHGMLIVKGPLGAYCVEEYTRKAKSAWSDETWDSHTKIEFHTSLEDADRLKGLIKERGLEWDKSDFYGKDAKSQTNPPIISAAHP